MKCSRFFAGLAHRFISVCAKAFSMNVFERIERHLPRPGPDWAEVKPTEEKRTEARARFIEKIAPNIELVKEELDAADYELARELKEKKAFIAFVRKHFSAVNSDAHYGPHFFVAAAVLDALVEHHLVKKAAAPGDRPTVQEFIKRGTPAETEEEEKEVASWFKERLGREKASLVLSRLREAALELEEAHHYFKAGEGNLTGEDRRAAALISDRVGATAAVIKNAADFIGKALNNLQ